MKISILFFSPGAADWSRCSDSPEECNKWLYKDVLTAVRPKGIMMNMKCVGGVLIGMTRAGERPLSGHLGSPLHKNSR